MPTVTILAWHGRRTANDYNLNISRYISTAVSEEEVDLAFVYTINPRLRFIE